MKICTAFGFLLIVVVFVPARPCAAWNGSGHEIVAQIGFDQLSPDVKAKITEILKQHQRYKEDLIHDAKPGEPVDLAAFLTAATWPDMVRSESNPMHFVANHPQWHYVDFPYDFDGVQGEEPIAAWDGNTDPENLLQAMEKLRKELADPKTSQPQKAIDICWVEHLVGDIHQPLHATSLFSKEFPKGDKGGNETQVDQTGQRPENLHSYWDGIEGRDMDPAHIRSEADRIEKDHPAAEFKGEASNLDVTAWAKESFEIAKTQVYLNGNLPHSHSVRGRPTTLPSTRSSRVVPLLPDDYEKNGKAAADKRIALAGYRLASMLLEISRNLPPAAQP